MSYKLLNEVIKNKNKENIFLLQNTWAFASICVLLIRGFLLGVFRSCDVMLRNSGVEVTEYGRRVSVVFPASMTSMRSKYYE